MATVNGTRYLLRLGPSAREGLLAAVRTARAKAAAERGVLGPLTEPLDLRDRSRDPTLDDVAYVTCDPFPAVAAVPRESQL